MKIFLLCNEFTLIFSGVSGRTIRRKAAVQSGGVMVDLNEALLPFDFCEDNGHYIIPSMLTSDIRRKYN